MRRLLFLSLLLTPLGALAGPPTDGVCGELKGGTPGLFGLCVAFCEAQDLGGAPESKQSAFSLLAAYEARRGPEDPDMPCLDSASTNKPQPPAASCSCWTAEDLMTVLPQPDSCYTNGAVYTSSQFFDGGATSTAYLEEGLLGGMCSLQDGAGQTPDAFDFGLTDSEVEGCKALWTHHAQVTGCM